MIFYYKYYFEIKNRLFLTLACWLFIFTICYLYKETLLFLLTDLSDHYLTNSEESYFIFTDVSEVFLTYLQLIFFISNQLTLIVFSYHLILFLSSGLYREEYKKLLTVFKIFIFSWIISIFLLNNFVFPSSINFFLSFQQTTNSLFFFEAKIMEYFIYFNHLYQICFISCQLLTGTLFVLINSDNNLTQVRKFRKLFYLIFLIFATTVTPPDIISQFLIEISLISLYELALITVIINKATN